jgi:hypothetical protein
MLICKRHSSWNKFFEEFFKNFEQKKIMQAFFCITMQALSLQNLM